MAVRKWYLSVLSLVASGLLVAVAVVYAADVAEDKVSAGGQPLIIGTELDYPPYSFNDKNGKASGYNVDLTRAIARVMDLDIEIRIGPWGEIRQALEAGEIDAIAGMYFSVERDLAVDFSPTFTWIHHAIFLHENSPEIASEDDLRGLNIIVMQGDIMHDYVLANRFSEAPVTVATQADALRLLAEGQHDCALIAELPGLYWVRELGLDNVKKAKLRLDHAQSCFAVAEGNTDLRSALTNGLAIVNSSGKEQAISDRWLGVLEPRGMPTASVVKYAAIVMVPVMALMALIFMRSRLLNRQIADRNSDLQERAKELNCLFSVSDTILRFDTIADLLQNIAELIPSGWRFPDRMRTRIEFGGREFVSRPFSVTPWFESVNIVIDGEQMGTVAVYYLDEKHLATEGVRLAAERNLIQTIGRLLSKALHTKLVERRFLQKEIEYRNLFQGMLNGVALHEIICDEEGTPVDYRFLDVNPAFEKLTGLSGQKIISKTVREVMPATEPDWIRKYGRVALEGDPISFEQYAQELDRHFAVTAFQHGPGKFACIFEDITVRRSYEDTLANHRSRLQLLASELVNAEDRLRQSIAAGLHDSIGQDLAALKLTVDIMRLSKDSRDESSDGQDNQSLVQVSESLDGIVQEIWSLAFQLCPPGLYEAGLLPAVEWLIEQFDAQHNIVFDLVVVDEPVWLEMQARGLVFQMIRELIGNAIKHAQPERVTVELLMKDGYLVVTVADDGCGFEVEKELSATEAAAGFGLFSIRERLAFLAGRIEIESAADQGTRIMVFYPMHKQSRMETELAHEQSHDTAG